MPTPTVTPSGDASHARTLAQRYFAVLLLVGALIVIDQAVIQPALVRLSLFAPVINVAGRQRMLSQRITKAALVVAADENDNSSQQRAELRTALQEFVSAHEGLQSGSEVLGLPPLDSPRIAAAFANLNPHFERLSSSARTLADSTARDTPARLAEILVSEAAYLPRMDRIVGLFEAEARSQVGWLRLTDLSIAAVVLLMLGGLGWYVLRPASRLITSQFDALSKSERRFRTLVEQMSDGLAVYRPGGELIYVNDRLCTLLSHSRGDLIGRPFCSFAAPESREGLLDLLARTGTFDRQQPTGEHLTADVVWRDGSGESVYTQVSIGPPQDGPDDRPLHFSVITDITDRKRAEDDLRDAHAQLERRVAERTEQLTEANAALTVEMQQKESAESRTRQLQEQLAHAARVHTVGRLATGLAHEINQPLGAITNYAEGSLLLLEDEDAGSPTRGRLWTGLMKIRQSALRAGAIVSRLRTFVQNRPGQRAATDINALVHEVVELVTPELRDRGIDLDVDLFPAPLVASLDGIPIQQVLVNLVQNAAQAMRDCDASARRLQIETSLDSAAHGPLAEVRVRDTGVGLGASTPEAILQPFYTTKSDGLGMGLSISQSILHDHGGRLSLANNSDRGVSACFTLPVVTSGEPEAAQVPEHDASLAAEELARG